MSFYWNDGGRAAAGFTVSAVLCYSVYRNGTGISYRAVYDQRCAANKTPRNGLSTEMRMTIS